MNALWTMSHRLGFEMAGRFAVRRGDPANQLDSTIRGALSRALSGELDASERYWTDTIESLRKQMMKDETTVTYQDYGVRNAENDDPPTVTRTLKQVVSYSVPRHEGLALFNLVRALRPNQCLELGTCVGISAAYIAAAMDLNEEGKLTTLEGGKDLARVASINFTRMQLKNVTLVSGSFEERMPQVLSSIAPVDFAYIDGHHDGEAMKQYFSQIVERAASPVVVVFDDIRWSRDMRAAWRSVTSDQSVIASYDLLVFGVCLVQAPDQTAHE